MELISYIYKDLLIYIYIIFCLPPMGAAKQVPRPKAQAAANISVLRDSFW